MDSEMIERPSGELISQKNGMKSICVDRHTEGVNVPLILGHLTQYANLASIAGSVKKGMQYVVEVPTHLQAALESGQYTMLQGQESGKTWATIVKKLPSGKNEFVANCPIKEEAFYYGNPLQDMSSSLAHIQLQQQMATLAELVGKTYDAILRIEEGQKADRIGQLIAGRDGVVQALRMNDAESRKHEIANARNSLREAQGKIGAVLQQKVANFTAVPKSHVGQFFMAAVHDGFLNQRDDEYDSIMEYFALYLQATQLLAETFIICCEKDSAASVYEASKELVASLDFSKVKSILYAHPQLTEKELFFYGAIRRIEAEKARCLDAAKPFDYMQIAINGEELLEVLENGKESQQQENE